MKKIGTAVWKKLAKSLFFFLLFLFPANLSKHFISDFSFVNGLLIDYLIPTVYLTDILIFFIVLLWLSLEKTTLKLRFINLFKISVFFSFPLVFLVFLFFSVIFAFEFYSAVYKFIRISLYILLFYYILFEIDFRLEYKKIFFYLGLSAFLQSILAAFQFLHKGSLFGFWFLGEPRFGLNTPAIKKVFILNALHPLPFGTFPHPNVLGGVLSIILPWQLYLFLNEKKNRFYYLVFFAVGIFGWFLSFSFISFITLPLGLLGVFFITKKLRTTLRFIVTLSLVVLGLLFLELQYPISLNLFSFSRRIGLLRISSKMVLNNFWFGVGLNNFTLLQEKYGNVFSWERFVQPVHNIFMLVFSESGVFSFIIFFLMFIYLVFELIRRGSFLAVSIIQLFVLGLFDHFLMTLPQGLAILWLTLAFSFSTIKESYESKK